MPEHDAVDPPTLSDGVVTLRAWSADDVPVLPGLIDGDEEIVRWLDMMPSPYTEQDAREWIERAAAGWRSGAFAPFAIVADGAVAGGLGFNTIDRESGAGEIGYWLTRAARGRGLTTRALLLAARWGFDGLGLERIQLRAEVRNLASCRVAEKAGFTREGVLRSARYNPRQDRRLDFALYSLLPGELD